MGPRLNQLRNHLAMAAGIGSGGINELPLARRQQEKNRPEQVERRAVSHRWDYGRQLGGHQGRGDIVMTAEGRQAHHHGCHGAEHWWPTIQT